MTNQSSVGFHGILTAKPLVVFEVISQPLVKPLSPLPLSHLVKMSTATHAPHGNLHHPAPLTPILLQRLRDQGQEAQNWESWPSSSSQAYWEPSRASFGSYKPPCAETTTHLDYSLCAEASRHYDDVGTLARAEVQPSTARQICSMEPMHIHSLVQQHAYAMMVYHTALELHRTTSRVLTGMRSQRDAVFGPGVWIMDHLELLNRNQRTAAEDGMRNWSQEYAQIWPLIAQNLTALEPLC
ncbi:hypothetical protein BKA70DRAFT_1237490 [Coprinopsis sp. MPI-PUGE-AT-0042]|nr:hypothetical protein BKA70DRAFT_1237490 [Coprinopsis sp. MPI-PUGE-AT-0042]